MAYCPNCGNVLNETTKFCPRCGAPANSNPFEGGPGTASSDRPGSGGKSRLSGSLIDANRPAGGRGEDAYKARSYSADYGEPGPGRMTGGMADRGPDYRSVHMSDPKADRGSDYRPDHRSDAMPDYGMDYRSDRRPGPMADRGSDYSSERRPDSGPGRAARRPGHKDIPLPRMKDRGSDPLPDRRSTRPSNKNNRLVKGLISLGVALILLLAIILFFQIDLSNMDGYVETAARHIRDFGIFVDFADTLAVIAVYGLTVMILLSAYMLPARISGAIYKTCSVMDKVIVTISGYFIIAFIIFLKEQVVDKGIIGVFFSRMMQSHGGNRVVALLLFLLLLALLAVPVIFIAGSFSVLLRVVVNNIAVNGPVLGTVAAAYDLLSSVFVTALVLCAFSFGVAIILLPLLIMIGCSSGGRIVYDENGNRYYVI